MNKTRKFERSGDYYKDLAMRESSNRPDAVQGSYTGLYQMGSLALIDTGYIDKTTKKWTGKNGIKSKEDFIKNPAVQEIAVREYHKIIWEDKHYLKNYQSHIEKEIEGVKLTQAGMLAAAHLVGSGKVKEFIDSNGKVNKADNLGTTCKEYLEGFSDEKYNVDYSTNDLLEKYFQEHPELKEQKVKLLNSNQTEKDKNASNVDDKLTMTFRKLQERVDKAMVDLNVRMQEYYDNWLAEDSDSEEESEEWLRKQIKESRAINREFQEKLIKKSLKKAPLNINKFGLACNKKLEDIETTTLKNLKDYEIDIDMLCKNAEMSMELFLMGSENAFLGGY